MPYLWGALKLKSERKHIKKILQNIVKYKTGKQGVCSNKNGKLVKQKLSSEGHFKKTGFVTHAPVIGCKPLLTVSSTE